MNYTINEKTIIEKKIKSCREVPLEIKMEKGNNLRIFCSTTAFENIRKIIIETVASNYVLEMTENKDISERVIIETIKTKERNARRALPIFVINIYRTTSTLLINGPQVQRFVQEILPVLQSCADQNEKEIDICDQHLKKILRKVYPGRQMECSNSGQHEIDHKIKRVNDHNGETNRKKTLPKMTGKQTMKHRNVTIKFTSITGMMRNMSKLRRSPELKKRKLLNQKITMRKKLNRTKRSL